MTERPINPASSYSYSDLIDGDPTVEWPPGKKSTSITTPQKPNPRGVVGIGVDGLSVRIYTVSLEFDRYCEKGYEGALFVFTKNVDGKERDVYANNVWSEDGKKFKTQQELDDWLKTEFPSGALRRKDANFKDAPLEKIRLFDQHTEDEFLYYTSMKFGVLMTKKEVLETLEREKEQLELKKEQDRVYQEELERVKPEMFERVKKWKPQTSSSSINGFRLSMTRDKNLTGIYCNCGHPADVAQVKNYNSPNRGEWFWTCIVPYETAGRCIFFKWVNPMSEKLNFFARQAGYDASSYKKRRRFF